MRRKRIISLVLSACLIVGSAVQGGAATTQEKISDAKAQQQENQSSLQQTQEKIQELESKKGESETYLADLNTQLDDLRSSLEKLQNDYDAKQEELTQLQSDLEDAKADEAQQYEAMKLRIRYMYENSASNYMNLLFESGSISDFLNQAENISQMSKYYIQRNKRSHPDQRGTGGTGKRRDCGSSAGERGQAGSSRRTGGGNLPADP